MLDNILFNKKSYTTILQSNYSSFRKVILNRKMSTLRYKRCYAYIENAILFDEKYNTPS